METDPLAGWELADDLMVEARRTDPTMTRTKLVRLHKKGLIPRPVTRHRRGARGLETLYPPGTGKRLTQVLTVGRSDRRFGESAWTLWWEGNGSPIDARPLLDKTASSLDRTIAKMRAFLDRHGQLTDAGEEFLERSTDSNLNLRSSPLGWIGRRLGRSGPGRDAYENVMLILVRIIRGNEITEDDAQRFERAIGIDEARTFSFSGGEAWPPDGSMLDSLVWMAKMLTVPFAPVDISDDDLEAAKLDTQQFLGMFVDMNAPMRSIFGRWGPGFSFIGHLAKWMLSNPGNQAMAVLLFHRLRSEPMFQPGMEQLRPTAEEWKGHGRAWEALQEIGEAVPALGKVITSKRLGAAMQSEDGQRQLEQAIAEVRADHAEEIDQYFADHPELASDMERQLAVASATESHGAKGASTH